MIARIIMIKSTVNKKGYLKTTEKARIIKAESTVNSTVPTGVIVCYYDLAKRPNLY